MARTTPTVVQALLEAGDEYNGTTDLTTVIDEASLIVDDIVACAAAKNKTLSAAKLAAIEARLAAHGYLLSDKAAASESVGRSSITYQGKTDKGFEGTYHGQQAMRLDTSGCLASMNTNRVASVTWGGKMPSQRTPFWERDAGQ